MKYRKKPVEIDAIIYKGTWASIDEIRDWANTFGTKMGDSFIVGGKVADLYPTLKVKTLEGDMHVPSGNYIIRGVVGEYYSCDPEVFEKSYDPAD